MKEVKISTKTIIDIVNNVPADKIDNAIQSLKDCICQFLAVKEALELSELGQSIEDVAPKTITWIDDDMEGSILNINTKYEDGSTELLHSISTVKTGR